MYMKWSTGLTDVGGMEIRALQLMNYSALGAVSPSSIIPRNVHKDNIANCACTKLCLNAAVNSSEMNGKHNGVVVPVCLLAFIDVFVEDLGWSE
ncbi:unnamed protein product [Strongylus vulgaris]|uniref:Uncharacterized protein n=1 Tax=Strongylus vulgaris TaxID=40348 RepID=A0A3P7ICY6_STRVU|nr:unnamed protein product [Strongylus vulgaris]